MARKRREYQSARERRRARLKEHAARPKPKQAYAGLRTFEYDDYPMGPDELIAWCDWIKRRYPDFKCTIFAVPERMTRRDWRPLLKRASWLHVAPHGFAHRKKECRHKRLWTKKLHLIDRIAKDNRWTKVFKAPWYGLGGELAQELTNRGFRLTTKVLQRDWPMPTPADWLVWNIEDARMQYHAPWEARRQAAEDDPKEHKHPGEYDHGVHVVAHPCYEDRGWLKSGKTEINEANTWKWSKFWTPDDKWAFVEDLAEPCLLKLNLGCGPDIWDGWTGLDPRAHQFAGARAWSFDEQIPYGANRADVVVTSHVFNYVDESDWLSAMLEIWRVLRPGGIWRMQEDRTDNGYCWRRPGEDARGTGTIRSMPTMAGLVGLAAKIGFKMNLNVGPGKTGSPHRDVLQGDNRSMRFKKGHKFYAEATKEIDLHPNRPKLYDARATRKGRYKMPEVRETTT